jgi:uncharacterized membrane protein
LDNITLKKILKRLAKIISTVGNPLSIALFFGLYLYFFEKSNGSQRNLPLIFVLSVAIPMAIYIGYNVRRKKFADYDVSDRTKREGVYKVLIGVFLILNLVFYFFDFDLKGKLLVTTFLLHSLSSYLINKRIKVSMHTSYNFLFSIIFYPINPQISLFLFGFGFINAWSRLALSRHKTIEVILGFLTGVCIGGLYLYVFKLYI